MHRTVPFMVSTVFKSPFSTHHVSLTSLELHFIFSIQKLFPIGFLCYSCSNYARNNSPWMLFVWVMFLSHKPAISTFSLIFMPSGQAANYLYILMKFSTVLHKVEHARPCIVEKKKLHPLKSKVLTS